MLLDADFRFEREQQVVLRRADGGRSGQFTDPKDLRFVPVIHHPIDVGFHVENLVLVRPHERFEFDIGGGGAANI